MDTNRTQIILGIAFILSVIGLFMSIFYPEISISDDIIIASLFLTSYPLIASKLSIHRLVKTIYWKFILAGFLIALYSLYGNFFGHSDMRSIVFIAGSLTFIIPLILYIYILNPIYSRQSKWMILFPMILLGTVFKMMHWPGGNIIIFVSLLAIIGTSIFNYIRKKNFTFISTFLLLWFILICGSIGAYYFHYVRRDYFILGALLICSALLEILIQQENDSSVKE